VCHERTIDFERHSCIAVAEHCIYNSAEIKSQWSAGQAMCLNGSSRSAMFRRESARGRATGLEKPPGAVSLLLFNSSVCSVSFAANAVPLCYNE